MPPKHKRAVQKLSEDDDAIHTFMDALAHPEKYPERRPSDVMIEQARKTSRAEKLETENSRLRAEIEVLRTYSEPVMHYIHIPETFATSDANLGESGAVKEFEQEYEKDDAASEPQSQPKGRKIVLDG